jgi:AcrR family transcriptional regulator
MALISRTPHAAAAPLATNEAAGPDRIQQIVDAAYELLDEAGIDGLTIRALLKRTGLSRRAFYERFPGKDDLVLAVFEETIRRAADQYGKEISALIDPLERLKLIVTSIVLGGGALENERGDRVAAALSREHLRLAEARPDDLQAALRPLIGLIAQQLSDGMAMGSVRNCVPQRLAVFIFNLISTTMHSELLGGEAAGAGRIHRGPLADEIWEFCRRAIAR